MTTKSVTPKRNSTTIFQFHTETSVDKQRGVNEYHLQPSTAPPMAQ